MNFNPAKFNPIQKLKRDFVYSDDLYTSNEQSTNRVVCMVALSFVLLCIVDFFLVAVDYSPALDYGTRYVIVPISILIILMVVVAWMYEFSKPWIKYMLFSGVVLATSAIYCLFTYYANYLLLLPVVVSMRYFDLKFIKRSAFITWFAFLLASILNVVLADTEFFMFMHEYTTYNSWLHWTHALVFILIPFTVTFWFVVRYAVSVADRGRELMREQKKSAEKIAAANAELDAAAKIQASTLPLSNFQDPAGHFTVTADERMAKYVGGDFYDFRMIDKDRMMFLVADVSDKGLPAAMFMMSTRKTLECMCYGQRPLINIINLANRVISADCKGGMFLTLWMGFIDVRTGMGKFANAGHHPPIIKRADGSIENLANEPNVLLGLFPEEHIDVHTFQMRPGDTLLLFTDGATDAMNERGQHFEKERLEDVVRFSDAKELNAAILSRLDEFTRGAEQFDDITLLSLHCNAVDGAQEENFSVSLDGTDQIIDRTNAHLTERGCPEDTRRNIDVILDEMCDANPGASLDMRVGANFITLTFATEGPRQDPLSAIGNSAPEEEPGEMGLYLVRKLADDISYQYADGRNILTIRIIWNM